MLRGPTANIRRPHTSPALGLVPTAAQRQVHEDTWNEYLREIARGDQQSLARLYDQSKGLVYGLALRIVNDAADAEEVTLDVYMQVWRSAPSFDLQRGAASTWLVTITRSRAIDRIRSGAMRRREESLAEILELPAAAANPEQESATMQQHLRVRAALKALSPEQREAVELAFFYGLSHSELAAKLGQPLGTIKTRIRQGMMKLREQLELVPDNKMQRATTMALSVPRAQ